MSSSSALAERLLRRAVVWPGLWLASACALQQGADDAGPRFPGAHSIPRSELLEAVANAAHPDAPADEAQRAQATAVRRAYQRRGFADVVVEPGAQPDGTPLFQVQEGRRFVVAGVAIAGNATLGAEALIALSGYADGAGPLLPGPPLASGDPFDPVRVERWAVLVQNRYIDLGWLDARVEPPQVERDDAAGTVAVTLKVAHEGPRYRVRDFLVPDAVRALLGDDLPEVPRGEFCTRERAEALAAAVFAGLRRRGHPQPELQLAAERHADASEVTLRLAVVPGAARTVAEVVVTGSRRVPDDLVRDRLGLRPGTRFDGDVERRGLRALSATGEFARLDVRYEPLDDDRLRVVVETEETTGLLPHGAPYLHPWRRLGYNLLLEGRDALGDRHDLMGRIHVGHRGYHFGGRYLRSGIFDDNTSLSCGGDFFANERPAFTDRGAGGTIELRRYFSPDISVAASYSLLEHFDTTFDAQATTSVGRDYTEGRASLAVDLDRTDNGLLPTRGHKAFVRVDRVDEALGADVEFTRLRVGAGLWLPLAERLRWSLEVDAGWLWPDGGSAAVPVTERFFLGGYDTVRSFRESRLGPRDATGALRGGEFSNFARTEFVVQVVGPLDLALYADAGNVGADVSAWDLDSMRYALGVALRLMSTETGPLVVSAAYNPDRDPGEDEWVVDVAAGVIF